MRAVIRRPGRRRSRGVSIVELSIALPFLVVLLSGAGQVGALAYGLVSVDSAAREGARVAAVTPVQSFGGFCTGGAQCGPHTCTSPADDGNAACQEVWKSGGLLDGHNFTVKLSGNVPLASRLPADVVPVKATIVPCLTTQATVTGQAKGAPSGTGLTVSSSIGGAIPTSTRTGTKFYTLCVPAGTGTISAISTANCGNSGSLSSEYAGSSTYQTFSAATAYTVDFTVQSVPCSSPTTTTTTDTVSSTPTVSGIGGGTGSSSVVCANNVNVPDTSYVTVTVSYQVPIFVPFIDRIFADPGKGYRTVTTTVTMKVEPCGITDASPPTGD